jgi:glycosyltransferase involved in cell wall biosynthesis
LASIEAQTYKNWDILAWDNGSTDGTVEELNRWIPSRLRGRVISGEPLGLGASLARLVDLAQTELCAIIHGDDVNYPQRLELQVAFLEKHPEVALLGTNVEFIDPAGHARPCPDPYRPKDAEIRWLMRWQNPINHPSVMFRRSIVLRAGNYLDCQPYEDYELWFRMSLITEIANLPEVLLKYRKHPASISSTTNSNYFIYFQIVADMHAGSLFAGLGAQEGLELREKAIRDTPLPVMLADLRKYRQAAIATALHLGKPRRYFLSTAAYRERFKELARNYVVQRPAGRVVMGLKRLLT